MTNEVRINTSMNIRASTGPLQYQNEPSSFQANMSGAQGPSPGSVIATPNGTVVTFPGLTSPRLCRIMNQDPTNWIAVGMYDGVHFYPMIELLPGETYIVRLSRHLGGEYTTTGTGSIGHPGALMVKCPAANAEALIEAFNA